VKDDLNAEPLDERSQQVQIPHIALDDLDVLNGPLQVEIRMARDYAIQDMNLRASLQKFKAEMGAAESCTPGHKTIAVMPEVRNGFTPVISA
jgi:hypothetical protein